MMKVHVLVLCAASAMAAQAQTAAKPATAAKRAATAKHSTARRSTVHHAAFSAITLPPGIPPVRAAVKTVTTGLRYQDIVVGTGPLGEDKQIWKVTYTGWRAADGVKFDSTDDHRRPEMKDGKEVTGPDGKPVLGDPEPLTFPHGVGRMIPGFDAGVEGMRVGGKRRIFIPWPMAYGYRTIADHGPEHPGIPPKSDLIFDVELLDVKDFPEPLQRPSMRPIPVPAPHVPATAPKPATPSESKTAPAPATPSTAPAPTQPQKPANPQN